MASESRDERGIVMAAAAASQPSVEAAQGCARSVPGELENVQMASVSWEGMAARAPQDEPDRPRSFLARERRPHRAGCGIPHPSSRGKDPWGHNKRPKM